MNEKLNLRLFRKVNSLTQDDIAEYLGVTKAFISQIENGRVDLPEGKLHRLLNNPHGWEIPKERDEKLTMFLGKAQNDYAVKLIPHEARGGSLGDFAEGVMGYECEKIISPIRNVDYAITVTGDSMAPEYPSGSTILIKKIDEAMFVEWGRVYVLDTPNGAVIKQILRTENPDEVECVSLNPTYQSFRVKTDHILGWYRVLMVMSMK